VTSKKLGMYVRVRVSGATGARQQLPLPSASPTISACGKCLLLYVASGNELAKPPFQPRPTDLDCSLLFLTGALSLLLVPQAASTVASS